MEFNLFSLRSKAKGTEGLYWTPSPPWSVESGREVDLIRDVQRTGLASYRVGVEPLSLAPRAQ